jgi:hypothetical protein
MAQNVTINVNVVHNVVNNVNNNVHIVRNHFQNEALNVQDYVQPNENVQDYVEPNDYDGISPEDRDKIEKITFYATKMSKMIK